MATKGDSAAAADIKYQYNKSGTIRAPLNNEIEVLLDVKLVSQIYATSDYLASAGGQAAEARSAGLVLAFKPASSLGIEVYNEYSNQWRPVASGDTLAVVASLPE
jgi:hypothetical protein